MNALYWDSSVYVKLNSYICMAICPVEIRYLEFELDSFPSLPQFVYSTSWQLFRNMNYMLTSHIQLLLRYARTWTYI